MKENGRDTQEYKIIREWRTKEINPQEIAEALRGVLKKTTENDPRWEIELNYGEPKPLFTLTCDPDNRTMFFVGNAPSEGADKACRFSVELSNIDDLQFVEYHSPITGITETDMTVNAYDRGSNRFVAGIGISSHASEPRF